MYIAISWDKKAKNYKYALLEMVYIVFLWWHFQQLQNESRMMNGI